MITTYSICQKKNSVFQLCNLITIICLVVLNVDSPCFFGVTNFFPNSSLRWCTKAEKQHLKERLVEEADSLGFSSEDVPSEPPSKRRRVDEDDLFDFMEASAHSTAATPSATLQEIHDYLDEPDTDESVLSFWRLRDERYPRLARLAAKFLSIPASSAPVERLFSVAGKVFRPERCRLTDKRFAQLMFIRCNTEDSDEEE